MEGVGIISSDFVGKLWDAGKEVNTTISNFVNQLDDGFSEKFNTELFTPQYLEEKHGEFISLNKCLDYFSKLQIEK